MKILVCIKQVGYVYHPLAIDAPGGSIDPEKMVSMLNPYDEIAVEEAVRIKECCGECEVILITAGPPEAEEALRYAFAFGADKMIRIHYEGFDPWATSLALGAVAKGIDYDVILCGKKAIDSNGNQVSSYLAELLGIPQVSGIVGLEIVPNKQEALAERYLGKGNRQVVACSLPALFTAEEGLNDPRYPSLPNRLRAERKEIQEIHLDNLENGSDREIRVGANMHLSPPRPRPKKIFTPDSALSPSERKRLVMSGGAVSKKGNLHEGKAEDIAARIVDVLVRERVV
jgi:electron transfer flavoprotein beta subunit